MKVKQRPSGYYVGPFANESDANDFIKAAENSEFGWRWWVVDRIPRGWLLKRIDVRMKEMLGPFSSEERATEVAKLLYDNIAMTAKTHRSF